MMVASNVLDLFPFSFFHWIPVKLFGIQPISQRFYFISKLTKETLSNIGLSEIPNFVPAFQILILGPGHHLHPKKENSLFQPLCQGSISF